MHPGMMWWWKRARRAAAQGMDDGFAQAGEHGSWPDRGGHGGHGGHGRHGCGPGDDPREHLRAAFREGRMGGGPGGGWGGPWGHHGPGHGGHGDGNEFGVRRPLRFLAYKLELDDKQVGELAKILDDLKTERAQAAVDDRRTAAAFAEAIAAETFDAAAVREAASLRVKTAEHLRDAVAKALGGIHAVLTAEQRQGFSYLVRTGALTL